MIVAAILTLGAFVAVERRAAAPIVPLGLLTDRRTRGIMLAGATGAFGLFAGALLLRYFQSVRDVSATDSGLLIYPLLLGLLISVNVAGAVIVRRSEFRTPCSGARPRRGRRAVLRDVRRLDPDWQSLVFMGLIGLGVGPTLSGLQIAIQRSTEPAALGAAMGTLMLLRQVGASIAIAAAATLYAGGLGHDAQPAPATGHAVFIVTLAGAAIAALALITLPRGAGRLPQPARPAPA